MDLILISTGFPSKGLPIRYFNPQHLYIGHILPHFQRETLQSFSFYFCIFFQHYPSRVTVTIRLTCSKKFFNFFYTTILELISQRNHFLYACKIPYQRYCFNHLLELTGSDTISGFFLIAYMGFFNCFNRASLSFFFSLQNLLDQILIS